MSRNIQVYAQTDVGRMRTENEDNFICLPAFWSNKAKALIGAIDGVGGYEGGAEAAALAKTSIENYLQHFSFGAPLQLLTEAIVQANNQIFEQRRNNPDLDRMSCVLSAAILDAEKEMMYIGHVGDSRGYILRNGSLLKITKDHSLVGMKEDSGYFSEEEAMHHPRRNEISKMLGEVLLDAADKDNYLYTTEHSFLPGDVVMFCSDGLTDLVNQSQIIAILSGSENLQMAAQQLIHKANELGGKDNITVVLATYDQDKKPAKKRTYKNVIELPVSNGTPEYGIKKINPSSNKKKEWFVIIPIALILGFLANWWGTKSIIPVIWQTSTDTTNAYDSIPLQDSLNAYDTLLNATDTIFRDSLHGDTTHHH